MSEDFRIPMLTDKALPRAKAFAERPSKLCCLVNAVVHIFGKPACRECFNEVNQ